MPEFLQAFPDTPIVPETGRMASTTNLRLELQADTSQAVRGVRQLSAELQRQKAELTALSAQEQARSSRARVGIAQEVLAQRQKAAAENASVQNLNRLRAAEERVASASNRASIASLRARLKANEVALTGQTTFERLISTVGQSLPIQFTGMASTFTTATGGMMSSTALLTGAIGLGLVGAIAAASAGVMAFGRAFSAAVDREVERVGLIGQTMQALNMSRSDATVFTLQTERKIAEAGRDLPVSTNDIQMFYRAAGDDLQRRMQELGRSNQQIQQQNVKSASQIAILAQLTGTQQTNALANIQAFIGGAGAGELRQMTLFQRSPAMLKMLQEGIRSGEDRVDLLIRALDTFITDDQINALQGTTKAQISAFMDSLFDPTIGLFSIERNIDGNIDRGEIKSVATEFSRTLNLLIGSDGIFQNLSETLGLSIDPMRALRDAIAGVNAFLEELNAVLRGVSALSNSLPGQLVRGGIQNSFRFGSVAQSAAAQANPAIGIGSALGGIVGGVRGLFGIRASGNIPDRMPLDRAIRAEMSAAPPGSKPVVANDSELIIANRDIAGFLAQIRSSGQQQPAQQQIITVSPSFIINAAPAQNEKSIADEVVRAIDSLVRDAKLGFA